MEKYIDGTFSTSSYCTICTIRLFCDFFIFAILFKIIVAGLNYFVPVDVNEVAAQSQKSCIK
jgi:hypothetical protein